MRIEDKSICRRVVLRAALGSGAVVGLAAPACAQTQDFTAWLSEFRAEARRAGISERTLSDALSGLSPIERVIELDRRQPETRLTFPEYLARVVTPARVQNGINRLNEHQAVLRQVSARFNVQARFIVALWGIESDFGRSTGNFSVIAALATLAHEGRRAQYFRGELLNALRIIDRGDIAAAAMRGSWAGAMGQCQFMPSSFLNFAVDFDGDGRADIWTSRNDVFASIANYLARSGWRADHGWGREVLVPPSLDRSLAAATRAELTQKQRPLADWARAGLRRPDGGALPVRDEVAALVQPDGVDGPAFMAYPNFRVIMAWNSAFRFAIAVGILADQIGGAQS
jgi:membrane-bound lytic murein transglycosylase B